MSDDTRNKAFVMLDSLREKTGYDTQASEEPGRPLSSRQIAEGTKLTITDPRQTGSFEATLTRTGPGEFEAEPGIPVNCARGDLCLVRYFDSSKAWEFDAPVVKNSEKKIVLGHSDRMRFHNRRRFPRIPINRPAHLARLPFIRNGGEEEPSKFRKASLVEIAGPGLKFEADFSVELDARMMVIFRLPNNKVVEGVSKVRRVLPGKEGKSVFAVELIGLTPGEVAELARATNAAAREQAANSGSPEAKQWKQPSQQESQDVRSS